MHYPVYPLRALIAVLLVMLLSCNKEKEEGIQPGYLIGTWTTIPNGQPYLRWTLDKERLAETPTKTTSCERVLSFITHPYAVVKDTLAIDWGVPKQIQDNFYLIKSLTSTRMVLYRTYFKEEAIFEKCQ